MPLFKKVQLCNLSKKYGVQQQGLLALESILCGEQIYQCDPATCSYEPEGSTHFKFTRKQLIQLIQLHPEASEYIQNYAVMIDDDCFDIPRYLLTQELTDECAFFNHSCDPNCDVDPSNNSWVVRARRDIKAGEELTIHYGCLETEESLMAGAQCFCGAANCVGHLWFDFWRDSEWQSKFGHFAAPFIQKKIRQLHFEKESQDKSN